MLVTVLSARYRHGPAIDAEPTVYGAAGPGFRLGEVRAWIAHMQRQGMRRVCCLLPQATLVKYRVDLLSTYRKAFGPDRVCHGIRCLFSIQGRY